MKVKDGKMPKKQTNVLLTTVFSKKKSNQGKTIKISDNNEEETLDMLKYREYTIVGTVVSPHFTSTLKEAPQHWRTALYPDLPTLIKMALIQTISQKFI